jgi:predicted transcriptional regulator
MKHEPRIREQAESGTAAPTLRLPTADDFARAKASYAAGEGVDHIVVGQWLLTWGSPDRRSFAGWLKDQDG